MIQVNNNAESLSRELRKLKNNKSIDFRGLLSGNCESYVSLYRHLFCENNLSFSHYIVDKGYDLSSLSDYKFMESVYKIMRDLFNIKPSINQNQFFSQGFTQRKLEMSTILAAHIRKLTNDLNNQVGKKTVQTQSLMKSSLKRPNSAPKQIRVHEVGDERDDKDQIRHRGSSILNSNHKVKKNKTNNRLFEKNSNFGIQSKRNLDFKDYESENHATNVSTDTESKSSFTYEQKQISNDPVDNRNSRAEIQNNYYVRPYNEKIDTGSVSAYELSPVEHDSYLRPQTKYHYPQTLVGNDNHERYYDVKQYTPRSEDDAGINSTKLDKVLQQFDTVLARISLLESRMQRIESKLDNNVPSTMDYSPSGLVCQYNQMNHGNPPYTGTGTHNYHDVNKFLPYSKNSQSVRDSRNVISDFESGHQDQLLKTYSDRPYPVYNTNISRSIKSDTESYSQPYQSYTTNNVGSTKRDSDRSYPNYGLNTSGLYRANQGMSNDFSNPPPSTQKYVNTVTNYSDKRSLDTNSSSRENSYRTNNINSKSSFQPAPKIPNGIPPLPPTVKKSDDSGIDENRHGKSTNYEKPDTYIQSQTDRIASLLSDTQKMLKISDEEI